MSRAGGFSGAAVAGAGDGRPPGADDLLDAERLEDLEEGLDLVLVPRDLERVGAGADVDDLAAEDVDDAEQLGAVLGGWRAPAPAPARAARRPRR